MGRLPRKTVWQFLIKPSMQLPRDSAFVPEIEAAFTQKPLQDRAARDPQPPGGLQGQPVKRHVHAGEQDSAISRTLETRGIPGASPEIILSEKSRAPQVAWCGILFRQHCCSEIIEGERISGCGMAAGEGCRWF